MQQIIVFTDRLKRIHYGYQRKTDDYHFHLKDYQEYNSVL
jgi:hypothetical protein